MFVGVFVDVLVGVGVCVTAGIVNVCILPHSELYRIILVDVIGTLIATPDNVVKSVYEILTASKPVLTLIA